MSAQSPLDALADELGAVAGRIERELRQGFEALTARVDARLVAIELAALKAENERQERFTVRLAELKDGKDGEPGRDADIGPLEISVATNISRLEDRYADTEAKIVDLVQSKLAEVKDGKDGADGKDADISHLVEEVEQIKAISAEHVDQLNRELTEKVNATLAKVKDGKDGIDGRDGVDGKDGEPGPPGERGMDGAAGKDGEPGKDGIDGKDGEPGKDGIDGKPGERGLDGKDGRDGIDGKDGLPGRDGKDGKLPIVREWTARVHYEGDVVRHNGSTYQAACDTGGEPPGGDWVLLAGRGEDGRGFSHRRTYDEAAEYRQHDIVMCGGSSFVALADNPGPCPGDGWQLWASAGKRGKEGPPGRVMKGDNGRDGAEIVAAHADDMALVLTKSDGDQIRADLSAVAEQILAVVR